MKGFRHPEKNRIGLDRIEDLDLGYGAQEVFEKLGAAAGMGGPLEPSARGEHFPPRRGEETHFRGELAGLLAAVGKLLGEGGVKEENHFAAADARFRSAEAKHIDADPPGDLGRGKAQRVHRDGET